MCTNLPRCSVGRVGVGSAGCGSGARAVAQLGRAVRAGGGGGARGGGAPGAAPLDAPATYTTCSCCHPTACLLKALHRITPPAAMRAEHSDNRPPQASRFHGLSTRFSNTDAIAPGQTVGRQHYSPSASYSTLILRQTLNITKC